jgi:Glyoxalase/Bleomycin resistance protein/Dioxygenase superfamily
MAHNLAVIEIKAFVPSKDFALSKEFYKDIGFRMASEGGGIAYFVLDHASFLLQDFNAGSLADNFMMHLLVGDVDSWWERIRSSGVEKKYGVKLSTIQTQPWRMRDFTIADPAGVLWRIAQNTE